jgi:hypothetical protein
VIRHLVIDVWVGVPAEFFLKYGQRVKSRCSAVYTTERTCPLTFGGMFFKVGVS